MRTNELRRLLKRAHAQKTETPSLRVSDCILAEYWEMMIDICNKNGVGLEALDIDEELDDLGLLVWISDEGKKTSKERSKGRFRYPTALEVRSGLVPR